MRAPYVHDDLAPVDSPDLEVYELNDRALRVIPFSDHLLFKCIFEIALIVQWILTKACSVVWTTFYAWFWYYGMSWAEISRVPLWHPWEEFFKGKNKMAARYFKVKYDFLTNEARNKCNTSFSCNFDWAIHFLHYFYHSRSSSRSKSQFQGQISNNTIFNNQSLEHV